MSQFGGSAELAKTIDRKLSMFSMITPTSEQEFCGEI
jgi:hypothetical protein